MAQLGLLDTLVNGIGYGILSDLRTPEGRRIAAQAAVKIVPQAYSLKEWNDAMSYLLGNPCTFTTPEQAHAKLVSMA